jgi:hypothetical protein
MVDGLNSSTYTPTSCSPASSIARTRIVTITGAAALVAGTVLGRTRHRRRGGRRPWPATPATAR